MATEAVRVFAMELLTLVNLDALSDLSARAVDVMLTCAAMSVLVVMIVEFVKPLIRHRHNLGALRGWVDGLESQARDAVHLRVPYGQEGDEAERNGERLHKLLGDRELYAGPLWENLAGGFEKRRRSGIGIGTGMGLGVDLPKRLFMRHLELATQGLIDSPRESVAELFVLSAGASLRDQLDFLEWVRNTSGAAEASLPADIELKSRRIAAAIERNLDELQLLLTQTWRRRLMGMAVIVGACVFTVLFLYTLIWPSTVLDAGVSSRPGLPAAVILGYVGLLFFGVVTGVFSTFVYDALVRVSGRRDDVA